MKHIVHVIPSLQRGGAEQTLIRLITHTDPRYLQHSIICLKEGGPLLEQVRPHLKHFMVLQNYPWGFFKLIKVLKEWAPDIVQTWMYNSNIIGALAAKLAGMEKVFWNIRITKLNRHSHNLSSFIFFYLGIILSYLIPRKVIFCSNTGIVYHKSLGYRSQGMVFIPNGLEVPPKKPISIRKKMGLDAHAFIIGMVARFNPQKDFDTFFHAADIFHITHPQTKFILAGKDISLKNTDLLKKIPQSLRGHIFLLGDQTDVKPLLASLDVFTLSSLTEGFPNVVAEAMSCGIPAVASDVGDAAEIIGDTGWIVPPKDPIALVSAWETALASDLKAKGIAARKRIQAHFSMDKMIDAYTNIYMGD